MCSRPADLLPTSWPCGTLGWRGSLSTLEGTRTFRQRRWCSLYLYVHLSLRLDEARDRVCILAQGSFAYLTLVVSYEVHRALVIAGFDESLSALSRLLQSINLVEVLRHLSFHLSQILFHSLLLGLLHVQVTLTHLNRFEVHSALGIVWQLL
jgi:hypothetical protein